MKTNHTTANTAATSTARIHSILAIVGIATAIICSLVLLNDQRTERSEVSFAKNSISSITEKLVKTNEVSLISRIQSIVNF